MDDFARLPSDERLPYFEQAAAQRGVTAQIIDKDFWVCWGLRRLFSLPEFAEHMTFKGGTSLSKVFRAIARFSEDVDVAIERGFLGFGGSHEPEKGATGKEQQRRIEGLKLACQAAIAERLLPQLQATFAEALADQEWELSLDPSDPDQQSLLFRFPRTIENNLSPYFASAVKFEFGARSDHFPVETGRIAPYVAEEFPGEFPVREVQVRVLAAARTFWEKATILHMLHHQPPGKRIAPRMSRHYYDIYQLAQGPVLDGALDVIELLNRVAEFKRVYFKAAWAKYDEARVGSLRLSPSGANAALLARDYQDMLPMFFGQPPSFEAILAYLPELERRINESPG